MLWFFILIIQYYHINKHEMLLFVPKQKMHNIPDNE